MDASLCKPILCKDDFTSWIADHDRCCRTISAESVGESGQTVLQWHLIAGGFNGFADVIHRTGHDALFTQVNKGGLALVDVDLLFYLRELHQLIGKLCRVHGRKRILVFELRREQGKE